MSFRKIAFVAAIAGLAAIGPANADGPRGHSIDLGSVNGFAYYTEDAGRFHVVATLAQPGGKPMRVEAKLAPGESITLSTPNERGAEPTSIQFSREANDLLVQKAAATN